MSIALDACSGAPPIARSVAEWLPVSSDSLGRPLFGSSFRCLVSALGHSVDPFRLLGCSAALLIAQSHSWLPTDGSLGCRSTPSPAALVSFPLVPWSLGRLMCVAASSFRQ